jgi:hypothetical protein
VFWPNSPHLCYFFLATLLFPPFNHFLVHFIALFLYTYEVLLQYSSPLPLLLPHTCFASAVFLLQSCHYYFKFRFCIWLKTEENFYQTQLRNFLRKWLYQVTILKVHVKKSRHFSIREIKTNRNKYNKSNVWYRCYKAKSNIWRMTNIMLIVTNHFNLCLSTNRSIFYFLKTANSFNSIVLYLSGVNKVISVTLLVCQILFFFNIVLVNTYIDIWSDGS